MYRISKTTSEAWIRKLHFPTKLPINAFWPCAVINLEMYLGLPVSYVSAKRNDVKNTSRARFQAVVPQEMVRWPLNLLNNTSNTIDIEYLLTSTSHYINVH